MDYESYADERHVSDRPRTPVTRSDVFARYTSGAAEVLLPIVALDERDRALAMTRKGRAVLATKARPYLDGVPLTFDAVVSV